MNAISLRKSAVIALLFCVLAVSPRSYQRSLVRQPQPTASIREKLKRQVTVNFRDVPLGQFLESVGRQTGLSFKTDARSLKGEGWTSRTRVTLTLDQHISAAAALNLVLSPLGLWYTVRGDCVLIHAESELAYSRSYDVSEFVDSPNDLQRLLSLLNEALERAAIRPEVKPTCRLLAEGTQLLADLPMTGHDAIGDALELLRRKRRREHREQHLAARQRDLQGWNSAPLRSPEELTQTDILPHPNGRILPGRNYVYCVSFQLAWAELRDRVIGSPPRLTGDPELAKILNQQQVDSTQLSSDGFLTMAGTTSDDIISRIRAAHQQQFSQSPIPELAGDEGLIVYAHLGKQLAFAHDFERLEQGLVIAGADGPLAAFGVARYEQEMHDTIGKQVTVLDYGGKDDFILQLHSAANSTSVKADEILLAKVAPRGTLFETIAAVQDRVRRNAKSLDRKQLESGESLAIPVLNLRVCCEYPELCGRNLLNSGWEATSIRRATQTIGFRLDENGAILDSTAELEMMLGLELETPPPRHFLFDKPFLVMLQAEGARVPYLAIWVAGAELMEPLPMKREH